MTNYEEIRDKIRTGDIILFSGNNAISHVIKLLTQSKWSHIGMALRLPELDTIFLWEASSLLNLQDAIEGKAFRGVKLVPIRDRLKEFNGVVAIRHLIGIDFDEPANTKAKQKLMQFRKKVRIRPYEKDKIDLMRDALDGSFSEKFENYSSLYCTEIVAEAYQKLGLLPIPQNGLLANEYMTKDFRATNEVELLKQASLSIEVPITV
jgi:hypothetical protein